MRVDYREKASGIIDLLISGGVLAEVGRISYGDFIINDAITIERKTARDFLISIIDGRLFHQVSGLKKHCKNPVVLIEGNPYRTELDFDPMSIRGALISIKTIWHVPVIFSRSKEDTKDILMMIARQEKNDRDVIRLRGGYRPRRLKTRQLYILQGLPGVGPMLAKRLLVHFGSIAGVVNASIKELAEVEGLGEASAEKIREVLL